MPLWEYKILSSTQHTFANATLLESFLNNLGREQWEVVAWRSAPGNAMVFEGLARRPVQRDWFPVTLVAPRIEGKGPPPPPKSMYSEEGMPFPDDDGGEAEEEVEELRAGAFEMILPLLRRERGGKGRTGSLEYLAGKIGQNEEDLEGALIEAGLGRPPDGIEGGEPVDFGDYSFWLRRDHRGKLWLNACPVGARRQSGRRERELREPAADEPAGTQEPPDDGRQEGAQEAASVEPPAPAPEPPPPPPAEAGDLLAALRPLMRASRRGSGLSGSVSFLSRARKTSHGALLRSFEALGLAMPHKGRGGHGGSGVPPLEKDGWLYWLDRSGGGEVWINARLKADVEAEAAGAPEAATAPAASAEQAAAMPPAEAGTVSTAAPQEPVPAAPDTAPVAPPVEAAGAEPAAESRAAPEPAHGILGLVRPHLAPVRRGAGAAASLDRLAGSAGMEPGALLAALTEAGLHAPEKAREKPVIIEHSGEQFWLGRSAKDGLTLNCGPASAPPKARRPRSRRK